MSALEVHDLVRWPGARPFTTDERLDRIEARLDILCEDVAELTRLVRLLVDRTTA